MCRKIPNFRGGTASLASARRGASARGGFTVVELLVAVSLMSLIVVALYSMFNQTQKALRSNEAQVDSTERGRSVLELVAREIESAHVSMRPGVTNLWIRMAADSKNIQDDSQAVGGFKPAERPPRTNLFDNVYFQGKSDRAWRGMGFNVMVRTNTDAFTTNNFSEVLAPASALVGTLYRYETRVEDREYQEPTTNLFKRYLELTPTPTSNPNSWPGSTNFSQVADGIVHFRVLPYDSAGNQMMFWSTNLHSDYRLIRVDSTGTILPTPPVPILLPGSSVSPALEISNRISNVTLRQSLASEQRGETTSSFRSNALPAYLELELGVLDPDTLRQYNQFVKDGQANSAKVFVEKRMAKVQIFRKRIPLKTVAQ
jgi:prepilin-type N-terminal cleavage/methylation domain-containing protein